MPYGLAVDNWSSTVGTAHTAGDGQLVLAALNGLPTLPANRIYRLTAVTNPDTPTEVILGVFQSTGRAGLALTGLTAAAGYTDVNLAAGVVVQVRVCKATIDEIQNALDTLVAAEYNVAAYGAKGDGTTDDTAAIAAAWAASGSKGPLFIPPGYNCKYTGAGLAWLGGSCAVILGAGRDLSRITLGASSRLLDGSTLLDHLELANLWIEGGLGGFRSTFTGSNSETNQFYIHDCVFNNYTVAGVETNSPDWPWLRLSRNQFYGSPAETSIGIALTGYLDAATIEDNSFWANRINLKLGTIAGNGPGSNLTVARNNFMRIGPPAGPNPRIDVWIAPNPSGYTLAGNNLIFDSDRYGNENLASGDYRMVIADEGAGATNAARFPVLTADSTGFVAGATLRNIAMYNDTTGIPWIYSTTPNLAANRIDGFSNSQASGGVIRFRTIPTTFSEARTNLLGPFSIPGLGPDLPPQIISNLPGFGLLIDPAGLSVSPGRPQVFAGGCDTSGYVPLCIAPLSGYTLAVADSVTQVTDSLGGTDAAEIHFTGTGQVYHAIPHASIIAGVAAWIEFDAMQGSAAPLPTAYFRVIDGAFNEYFRMVAPVVATWTRYRFAWTPQSGAVDLYSSIENISGTGTVRIGRVRIYHAREPLNIDGHIPGTLTTASGATAARPTGSATGAQWYDTTLLRPIWWNGSVWKDAMGNAV